MKWPIRLLSLSLVPILIISSTLIFFKVAQAKNLSLNPIPTNLNLPAGQVTASYSNYLAPADASFHITFTGIGNSYDVQDNTTYLGWCVEDYPYPNGSLVTLYSSYDANLPVDIKTFASADIPLIQQGVYKLGDLVPWGEVNWVINNKGASTRDDIQNAIHLIVWGTATSTGSVSQNAIDLAAAAKSHNDFVPKAGQIIAVILYNDGLGIKDRLYQDSIIEIVMPPHPSVSLVKHTNGQTASDPNGADVPQLKPGDPVTWTYDLTNTGNVSIPKSEVVVTDNQAGVSPVFDLEIFGNGDGVFDPGETWQYKASGTAFDLVTPPQGTKVQLDACSLNKTQPSRTAYINTGTVSIPGANANATSSYCNPPQPSVSIVKYTNGKTAADPNGADVPQIRPGEGVNWTYKVTNTGNVSILKPGVNVTDNQTGITPVFDLEISGNGDAVFNPGEVWQYSASGTALDLSLNPSGVTIVQNGCTYKGSMPTSAAYVNTAIVTIPGASANATSSYCNPVHYPYFGENGYLGVEDWYDGDYDYNDFGMYIRMEEVITYACNNNICGPYLTRVIVTTNAVIHDSSMDHLIHLRRPFTGAYSYTVTRSVPADPNPLVLFDGVSGKETPSGTYTGSGDLNVTLYNTAKYGRHQKNINENVVVDITLDNPLLNPRVTGKILRNYTTGSSTFTDLDPIMSNYDFWEEGTLYQSRWRLADTRPISLTNQQSFGAYTKPIPAGTVLPFLIVVPFTNWIPPFESSTITGPYGSFLDYYTTGLPADWFIPAKVTNSCVAHGGLSFGPYPGQTGLCGTVPPANSNRFIYLPVVTH